MGEWNYNNRYPGYGYDGNRSYSNRQQQPPESNYYNNQQYANNGSNNSRQYVGFQEFLNQYQQTSFQGFANGYPNQGGYNRFPFAANNDMAYNFANQQQQNYTNQPQESNSAQNKPHYQNSRVPSEAQRRNTAEPANASNPIESSSSDKQISSKSKLTATAEEFVPSKSRWDNSQESNHTKQTQHVKKEEHKETPIESRDESTTSVKSAPKNNSSKGNNKNAHWRQKEEYSEPRNAPITSVVFENNRNESSSSANWRDSGAFKPKKEPYQSSKPVGRNGNGNSNDRGRSYNNYRSQNADYEQSAEPESAKYGNRQKSYMSNETFRQRNNRSDRRTDRNDEYASKENDYDYGNGGRGAVRKSSRNQPFGQTKKRGSPVLKKDIDMPEVSQKERLTEQLNKGVLECLVCCECIKQPDSIWSCSNCFHVLHLSCIIKWANSSIADGGWRCPACQNNNTIIPNKYKCFCGKHTNPEWARGGDSAHTCGNICGKLPASCLRHPCTLLCHAGPCPQCDAVVLKKCECGATEQSMRCSHSQPLLCGQVCNKQLNCREHRCQEKCHAGACEPCGEAVEQECYCSRTEKRTLPCDTSTIGIFNYSCGEICLKKLMCGAHNCTKICHKGDCEECQLLPKNVKKCPCGQTLLTLEQVRNSCEDPIPVCDKICSKQFDCGPSENKHKCVTSCHAGDCPLCVDKTEVPCRCSNITVQVPCVNLEKERHNIRCKRKCSKKQSCGRHRCKTLCCIDVDHRCPLPCNRSLTCGLHRCEDTCHSGRCDLCWRTSFDELRCRCGEAVRYPPIPCGTRPPSCTKPCSLTRPCGHPPLHLCHPEPSTCPPCAVLTQRYCYGRHRMRKTIPCHQEEFSCGLPCGKDLPCGKHKCIETCHKGPCPTACTQQCETERLNCSHPCNAPCGHPGPCPILAPCKRPVNVTCMCKRRTSVKACAEHMRDLQRLQANTGMLEGSMGKPIDIKELIEKGNTTVVLDCDDECYVEERNRRMAIGLQIRNPDISSKLMPRYSEFMKQFITRDESFCVKVHEKLTELVQLAQKSKQKTRSHSFQPMNHLKRQFVHEYCEQFGCESKAYDTEPYRNIVATAYREKSWLPALSLIEVVRRDKGQRRVPGPIISGSVNNFAGSQPKSSTSSGSAWSTLSNNYAAAISDSTRLTSSASLGADPNALPEPARKPKIDYFDAPPED